MVNAVLVCIAVLLAPASVRVREPSWPMAAEATATRQAPVRVAPVTAPMPLEVAVPEDRPSAPRPRVVLPPGPGWPSASMEPAPDGAKRERRAVARRSRR